MNEIDEITEEDTVTPSLFGWCATGHHKDCRRQSRRFVSAVKKTGGIEWLKEVYVCSCKKRGCPCYTKPADRPKPAKKRTRRKN